MGIHLRDHQCRLLLTASYFFSTVFTLDAPATSYTFNVLADDTVSVYLDINGLLANRVVARNIGPTSPARPAFRTAPRFSPSAIIPTFFLCLRPEVILCSSRLPRRTASDGSGLHWHGHDRQRCS